jgi:DNA-binding NarL/FixJ family response regulator
LGVPIVIRPRVYFRTISRWDDLADEAEKDIAGRVSKIMLERMKITERELMILKDFANDLTGTHIADRQNIGIETIKTHSKKVLKKARYHLSPSFNSIKEVALYLKNIEII